MELEAEIWYKGPLKTHSNWSLQKSTSVQSYQQKLSSIKSLAEGYNIGIDGGKLQWSDSLNNCHYVVC